MWRLPGTGTVKKVKAICAFTNTVENEERLRRTSRQMKKAMDAMAVQ